MEGLRGLAVCLVFLVHYVSVWDSWPIDHGAIAALAVSLHTIGQAGVDLFFVLSGYLIYGSLMERAQDFGRFMLRRIQRIYPTFLVMFAVYIGLSFALPEATRLPDWAHGRVVFLVQNLLLLPGLFVHTMPLLSVAWTLSYEMFYYLMIPILIAVFSLRQKSARWRVVFFASLVVLLILDGLVLKGPVRLVMFLAGVLIFETLKRPTPASPHSGWIGLSVLILGLLGMIAPVVGASAYVAKIMGLFLAFFVLCLVLFRNPKLLLARIFSAAPIRWLGNMSYSYYLIHSLALRAIFLVLPRFLEIKAHSSTLFVALLPFVFLLTLLPAAGLFLAVERPLSLKPWKRKTPDRTKSVPALSPADLK